MVLINSSTMSKNDSESQNYQSYIWNKNLATENSPSFSGIATHESPSTTKYVPQFFSDFMLIRVSWLG